MKKILLIFACLLLLFVAWAFPYIDELRHQGLTLETAYGYFFGGPDHPFNPNDAVPVSYTHLTLPTIYSV